MLAPWIASHFPPHRVYVEAFGGAASVLMRKPRSLFEIYNDRWETIVNVFQVLRDPEQATELERLLRLTPFARAEFERTALTDGDSPVEAARKTLLRSFMGFASAATSESHATGFRANSTRSNTSGASDWAHYPDHIERFTERLAGVVLECRDALQVIEARDTPDTLIYADPPYPHETRVYRRRNPGYAVEMTTHDHERLAAVLRSCAGMVVLSTYPSDLYERLYAGWQREECIALADGAKQRTEVLYLNAACAGRQRQQRLIA